MIEWPSTDSFQLKTPLPPATAHPRLAFTRHSMTQGNKSHWLALLLKKALEAVQELFLWKSFPRLGL